MGSTCTYLYSVSRWTKIESDRTAFDVDKARTEGRALGIACSATGRAFSNALALVEAMRRLAIVGWSGRRENVSEKHFVC